MHAKLLDRMREDQRKHAFVADPVRSFSMFACVGDRMGVPTLYSSDYVAPTTQDITEYALARNGVPAPPGFFVALGKDGVCDEITKKNVTAHFSKFKSDPAVVKYRKAVLSRIFSTITARDLLVVSRTCLEATESPEGRAFDSDADKVGPPNRYGVIDERQGFTWVGRP